MREHVQVLELRQQPDHSRRLDVRHDAPCQREPAEAGETDGVPRQRDDCALHDALRHERELFVGIPPVNRREPAPLRMARRVGLDDPVADTDEPEQRVIVVGDRRCVVGERHHLAFILQLPHVQQAGDVLEEHAERRPGR